MTYMTFLYITCFIQRAIYIGCLINPYLTNGYSHHYQLDESTFIFRGVRGDFYFLSHFFDEISLCKQNSP